MNNIEVKKVANKPVWNVVLEKKIVGKIQFEQSKFQYFPKGSHLGGEKFDHLGSCINSLF